jgi:hypothetical protein
MKSTGQEKTAAERFEEAARLSAERYGVDPK